MNDFNEHTCQMTMFGVKLLRNFIAAAVAVSFFFSGSLDFTNAQSSFLDPAFNTDGRVTTDFFAARDEARAIAIQKDGRIVVAGRSQDGNLISNFALARYNADGSLDASFGSGGKVTTGFFGFGAEAHALALQADGRIVVAGSVINLAASSLNIDFALARYNADGSLDTSFGANGLVVTDFFGFTDEANAIAIQQDGRIVAAGFSTNSDQDVNPFDSNFALARYSANGSLDTSFDADGRMTTDFFGLGDQANAVAIQSDGRIVAAGFALDSSLNMDFATARYTASGLLDNSFDGDGRVTTDFSGLADRINAVALDASGRIVAAGATGKNDSDLSDAGLARYNTNGSLDVSFGIGGRVATDFGGLPNSANAMSIQADGRIVVAGIGTFDPQNGDDFTLTRYLTNGSLDPRFGTGGQATTDFSSSLEAAFAVAIQADGRIIAAGNTAVGNVQIDFALARHLSGYDVCLQSGDDIFQFDSTTGDYLFARCSTGFSTGGRGTVILKGCTLTLQHNTPDKRVLVKVDMCQKKGTASVQVFSPASTFSISDRNTTDNTCACR